MRAAFLKACLTKLGLKVNRDECPIPSLSCLHVSSLKPADVSALLASLRDIVVREDDKEYIKGENDIFLLKRPSAWSMNAMGNALQVADAKDEAPPIGGDRIAEYNGVVKRMLLHEQDYPGSKETASFNHHAFYSNLKHYQSAAAAIAGDFGRYLLYGEVVTSTSTMLEKSVFLFYFFNTRLARTRIHSVLP